MEVYTRTEAIKLVMLNFVFMWVVFAIGAFTLGPLFVSFGALMIIPILAMFAILMLVMKFHNKVLNYLVSYLYVFVIGFSVYSTLVAYTGALGAKVVSLVVITCILIFAACACIGYFTNINFGKLGNILLVAFIALFLFYIIAIFVNFGHLVMTIVSGIGVVIFIGYTLYDFYILREYDLDAPSIPIAALGIFVDLLNLIIQALHFVYSLTQLLKDE